MSLNINKFIPKMENDDDDDDDDDVPLICFHHRCIEPVDQWTNNSGSGNRAVSPTGEKM